MTAICVAVSLGCIFRVVQIFSLNNDRSFQVDEGFYHESPNSLDAVYIGASNVYVGWIAPFAWRDHGIAVWSYSDSYMNAKVYPFQIAEIHKTQPDALLIINLNGFKSLKVPDQTLHRSTNYMRFSRNKLNMIYSLTEEAGLTGLEKLQYYFPVIRFHSRWSQLDNWDFTHTINGYKTGPIYNAYFTRMQDITENYEITDSKEELTEDQKIFLDEFIDYLYQYDQKILFVLSPQAFKTNSETYKQLNQMGRIVQEHGYDYLNMLDIIDDINIQTSTDFYNDKHTNVHGAIKYTDYLAQYLVDNYGFTDKRGQPGWESWDESVALYTEEIAPYSLPLEREHAPRDYELQAPVLNKVKVKNQTLTLSWKESPDAEGYDIYRKSNISGEQNWTYLTSTESDTLQYVDSDLQSGKNYTYTVVPKKLENGVEVYGNFDFTGVTKTTK